jgi:hypothetical protein
VSVTRLLDRAPVAASDQADLMDWLQGWVDGFKGGDYGEFRSVVVLLESKDGRLATISQSIGHMDGTRLIGLLMNAAHRKMDGNAQIDGLRQ